MLFQKISMRCVQVKNRLALADFLDFVNARLAEQDYDITDGLSSNY